MEKILVTKDYDLTNEPFQVVVKLGWIPNNLRITYSKRKGGVIIMIEELNGLERVISSYDVKGRSINNNWAKELKKSIKGIKPSDWELNDSFIDSYYQKH